MMINICLRIYYNKRYIHHTKQKKTEKTYEQGVSIYDQIYYIKSASLTFEAIWFERL